MPLPLLAALGIGAGTEGVKAITGLVSNYNAGVEQKRGLRNARRDIEQYTDKAVAAQRPFYDIGTRGASTLEGQVDSGTYDMPAMQYNQPQFNFQADPGYQFRLDQGNQAIQNSMASRGKGLSGATLRALQRYGSGLASQEYGNAYNRYSDDRTFGYGTTRDMYDRAAQEQGNRYNRQAGLANMGMNASNQLGSYYSNAGGNLADTSIGRGNVGAQEVTNRGDIYQNLIGGLGQLGGAAYGMSMTPSSGNDWLSGYQGGRGYTPGNQMDLSGSKRIGGNW